eukprot:CAMPEP_0206231820 /NCGR_PEP_ID=MMETSP0047_2-20121206/11055_1 /ASSEMBLY_ACC=CAM_ASM_000192 /TAXON_ID=195065 /ORGANISM="Chroomonas mesostigmatica_cf, Strain CCMP1168" /LENGTH=124 /DNA_ID=CAMNT_0053655453 /DNA_START=630 /DNA_END=1004 /DNA_ORIENTATION=-
MDATSKHHDPSRKCATASELLICAALVKCSRTSNELRIVAFGPSYSPTFARSTPYQMCAAADDESVWRAQKAVASPFATTWCDCASVSSWSRQATSKYARARRQSTSTCLRLVGEGKVSETFSR